VTLSHRDVQQALSEFGRLLQEAREAGWDSDPAAEQTALSAARRVLAEVDQHVSDRLAELAGQPGQGTDTSAATPGTAG
jgi:hypothetical protein